MNFLKTSFYSGIGTAISLVVKLVTNKVIAVYLGTNGMFLLGQLKDFLKVTEVLSHLGTTKGTIKYVSEFRNNETSLRPYLITGFKIHLIFSILICLFTVLFSEKLSSYLFLDSKYNTFMILLGISLVTISIHSFFMSVINGLKKVKLYVLINIIGALLGATILILLVFKFEVIGALYAFAINQIIMLLVSFTLILAYKPFNLNLLFGKLNMPSFKNLTKFSIMAIAGPICTISATLFVRQFLSDEFDQGYAGTWEGMWRISAMYLLFLTTTFKFYLLPTFSELSGHNLKQEVFKIWKFVFPLIIVISLVVYLLKDLIITILLDDTFLLIGTLMGFHLLGDIIKINGWVLGNVLIAKAKTKAFVLFQVEWAVVFAILTYIFVKNYGFIGVSIAYFGAYIIHFTLLNIYLRKLLWVRN